MNDVKILLERALDDDVRTALPVDPAADLARGRARLRRRRGTILGGVAASVLVLGAVPLALGTFGDSAAAPVAASSAAGKETLKSIALVSYTGAQPRGYTVAWVPEGWFIQGGTLGDLVIAPQSGGTQAAEKSSPPATKTQQSKAAAAQRRGAQDPKKLAADPSYYGDKLVVMSASEDEKHTLGTAISVDGRPGYLRTQEDTQILSYQSATGRWVDIQAPTVLGWGSSQIAKFASGITVSEKATNSYG